MPDTRGGLPCWLTPRICRPRLKVLPLALCPDALVLLPNALVPAAPPACCAAPGRRFYIEVLGRRRMAIRDHWEQDGYRVASVQVHSSSGTDASRRSACHTDGTLPTLPHMNRPLPRQVLQSRSPPTAPRPGHHAAPVDPITRASRCRCWRTRPQQPAARLRRSCLRWRRAWSAWRTSGWTASGRRFLGGASHASWTCWSGEKGCGAAAQGCVCVCDCVCICRSSEEVRCERRALLAGNDNCVVGLGWGREL